MQQGRFRTSQSRIGLVNFLDDLGPVWDAGCRFSAGRSSSGGCRRAPTVMGRLRPVPGGSGGRCITPGQDVLDRLGLLLYHRELLGKVLAVSPNSPAWEMGALRKHALSTSFISARLSERWLPEGPRCDFRRSKSEVSHHVQLLHQPRVSTTLVHLFECLGLVNLQDSHGVQGRGCLARSTISKSDRQLTGFGRKMRTIPPSGSISWAQVHHDHSLHLGNAHIPLAAPPSRVVRTEEMDERLLAMKGAIRDFISSSCTSGKKGTRGEHSCEPHPTQRNPAVRPRD